MRRPRHAPADPALTADGHINLDAFPYRPRRHARRNHGRAAALSVIGVSALALIGGLCGAYEYHEQYDDGMEYSVGTENGFSAQQYSTMATIAFKALQLSWQPHSGVTAKPAAEAGFTEIAGLSHGVRYDAVAQLGVAGAPLGPVIFASESVPAVNAGVAFADPMGDDYMGRSVPGIADVIPPTGANQTTAGWQAVSWSGSIQHDTIATYSPDSGRLGDSLDTFALITDQQIVGFYSSGVASYEHAQQAAPTGNSTDYALVG